MKITKNPDPTYNIEYLIQSIMKYAKLHYSLFGRYNGELMQQPREEILQKTSGTFNEFLTKNKLEALVPLLQRIHTTQGYIAMKRLNIEFGGVNP